MAVAGYMTKLESASFPRFQEQVVIKILRGEHFSQESSLRLGSMMRELFSHADIQFRNEQDLEFLDDSIEKTLLVFPGSLDIKKWDFPKKQQEAMAQLCRLGVLKILAVCAGGFFLSDKIRYNDEERVHTHRHMKLFRGICSGPVPEKIESAPPVQVAPIYINERPIDVAMNGGGHFMPSKEIRRGHDYEILATYDRRETSIAALACAPNPKTAGEYNAVLIGPHFEYEAQDLKMFASVCSDHQLMLKEMAQRVESSAQSRLYAMHDFLTKLGFK